MELVFQEKRMVFPSCVLRQCVSQEQTADLIVPDRLPDCERVLEAFGTVTVRSAEAGADSASVVGTVQAGVPHSLQTQLPFSVRRELTPSDSTLTLQCSVRLTAIDARMLNSRKLLVRATVLCCIEVFSAAEKCLYDIEEPSERLQLRRVELPARMALALGEKRFPVQEELELPEEYPAAAEVLKWTALPEDRRGEGRLQGLPAHPCALCRRGADAARLRLDAAVLAVCRAGARLRGLPPGGAGVAHGL